MAKNANLKLFYMRPKVHMFEEIGNLLHTTEENGQTLSPLTSACWSDEDFIGRVSRISRATHGLTATIMTLRRSLGLYAAQFRRQFGGQLRSSHLD